MLEIPEREMVVAKAFGITEDKARREWERYTGKTLATYGENVLLGGRHWQRWLEEYVAFSTAKRDRIAEARHRKALEDEAYRREAVTFGGWMRILGARQARGDELASWDAEVLAWYRRQPEPKPDGVSALLRFWADRKTHELLDRTAPVKVDDAIAAERRAQSLLDLQHSDLLDGLGIEGRP